MALTIPSITVPALDAGDPQYAEIPGRQKRKQLILCNEIADNSGARVFGSFDPPLTDGALDAADGTFPGVFVLEAGQTLVLGGQGVDISGPVYLTCPSGGGSTIHYADKA